MKKSLFILLLFVVATLTAGAVPAKPGIRVFTQSDGSTIHLCLAGDEWHHSFVTADGMAVSRHDNGDFYYRTAQGMSTVMAHDAAQRSDNEKQFVASNSAQMSMQAIFSSASSAKRSRALAARKASQVPQTGSPRVPVILVNYKDKKFISSNPLTAWQQQLCAANAVSVYQYFVDQSFGHYTPQFDVIGPVTLANNRSVYGGNDYYGNDKGVGRMVGEACQLADANVNWSNYDNDGDGVCDVVIVLYAGDGEASSYASDAANSVWPCQWDLNSSDFGRNLTLDGTTISKFAVFNELNGSNLTQLDGIGTMCHEFSHCLDLPDWYATDYSNHFGMGGWSLLDMGSYNNDGYTPCGYTAYERNFMGWANYTTPVEGRTYNIKSMANGGIALKVTSNNNNEYYILENIEKTGWNQYAPASGLQVTHVNYNATTWNNNTVNNSNVQGMTIIPADNNLKMLSYSGSYYADDANMVGDLYPYNGNNQLTATSVPAATLYNSNTNLDKPITEITKHSDGTVSFVYMALPLEVPEATQPSAVNGNSVVAQWTACDDAVSYTLKVNPKPSYELMLTESFVKCTREGTNAASNLNTYMDNTGWSGSALYTAIGGLRLGTQSALGTLRSPNLNMTNSGGKMTVVINGKAYNNDTNVSLKVTVGTQSQTVVFASSTSETKVLTFDCQENATQQVTFASTTTRKRVVLTGLNIYSGDASASMAPAHAPVENHDGDVILVTGITDTHYTVNGLTPNTEYVYTVKAVYAEGESEWSNVMSFTTTNVTYAPGDVNADGVVDVDDLNIVVNIILNLDTAAAYEGRADVSGDGGIDVDDLNAIIDIIILQ